MALRRTLKNVAGWSGSCIRALWSHNVYHSLTRSLLPGLQSHMLTCSTCGRDWELVHPVVAFSTSSKALGSVEVASPV